MSEKTSYQQLVESGLAPEVEEPKKEELGKFESESNENAKTWKKIGKKFLKEDESEENRDNRQVAKQHRQKQALSRKRHVELKKLAAREISIVASPYHYHGVKEFSNSAMVQAFERIYKYLPESLAGRLRSRVEGRSLHFSRFDLGSLETQLEERKYNFRTHWEAYGLFDRYFSNDDKQLIVRLLRRELSFEVYRPEFELIKEFCQRYSVEEVDEKILNHNSRIYTLFKKIFVTDEDVKWLSEKLGLKINYHRKKLPKTKFESLE